MTQSRLESLDRAVASAFTQASPARQSAVLATMAGLVAQATEIEDPLIGEAIGALGGVCSENLLPQLLALSERADREYFRLSDEHGPEEQILRYFGLARLASGLHLGLTENQDEALKEALA